MTTNPCEFCNAPVNSRDGDTVCKPCDLKLIADQAHFHAPKMTQRKCRSCSASLPVERYFVCKKCSPVQESESLFDGFDTMDDEEGDSLPVAMAKQRASKFTEPKTCKRCKETRPREEFGYHHQMTDGRQGHCKVCERSAQAKFRMKQKERANDLHKVS